MSLPAGSQNLGRSIHIFSLITALWSSPRSPELLPDPMLRYLLAMLGMHCDIDQTLIDRQTIASRIKELAGQISRDLRQPLPEVSNPLADAAPTGKQIPHHRRTLGPIEITLVPILAGSFMFVADLIRHLPLKMQIRMLSISSYPDMSTTSRQAQVQQQLSNLPQSLQDAHVLLVDDILDSGRTLRLATDLLAARQPATLRTCVLLRKQRPNAINVPVDHIAFDVLDRFVSSYGLDYNNYYRNLPAYRHTTI